MEHYATSIIGGLVGVITVIIGFVSRDFNERLKLVDKRSQEIETNYLSRFADIKDRISETTLSLSTEIYETKHEILNAMMKFTEASAKVQEVNRDRYADKAQVDKDLQGLNERIHENKTDIQKLSERL